MVRVSEKVLNKNISLKIGEQLTSYVASIRTKEKSKIFLDELLSEAELLVLAKRLSIVVMLEHEYSYTAIQQTLKVSRDTVWRIATDKDKGRFTYIEKQCGSRYRPKAGEDDIWDLIEKILEAGMAPQGKGRWRYLDEMDRKRKNKK